MNELTLFIVNSNDKSLPYAKRLATGLRHIDERPGNLTNGLQAADWLRVARVGAVAYGEQCPDALPWPVSVLLETASELSDYYRQHAIEQDRAHRDESVKRARDFHGERVEFRRRANCVW